MKATELCGKVGTILCSPVVIISVHSSYSHVEIQHGVKDQVGATKYMLKMTMMLIKQSGQ